MNIKTPKPGDSLPFVVAEWGSPHIEWKTKPFRLQYNANGQLELLDCRMEHPIRKSHTAVAALLGVPMTVQVSEPTVAEVNQ
jgi:hypothetical protein